MEITTEEKRIYRFCRLQRNAVYIILVSMLPLFFGLFLEREGTNNFSQIAGLIITGLGALGALVALGISFVSLFSVRKLNKCLKIAFLLTICSVLAAGVLAFLLKTVLTENNVIVGLLLRIISFSSTLLLINGIAITVKNLFDASFIRKRCLTLIITTGLYNLFSLFQSFCKSGEGLYLFSLIGIAVTSILTLIKYMNSYKLIMQAIDQGNT